MNAKNNQDVADKNNIQEQQQSKLYTEKISLAKVVNNIFFLLILF